MITFSIVTVCYNAETEIYSTLASVLKQSCYDYEFIIMDGGSKDKTVEIVKEYEPKFLGLGIDYKICSEPDEGIYNAMNKGIVRAKGKWLIFLNAGDYFSHHRVLEKVKDNPAINNADVIYGDMIYKKGDQFAYRKCEPLDLLERVEYRMPFCHQCVFTRTQVMKDRLFDEYFKISADHDFFLNCYVTGKKFHYINIPVSVFKLGGVSTAGHTFELQKECLRTARNHGVVSSGKYIRETLIICMKHYIRKICPEPIMAKHKAKQNAEWADAFEWKNDLHEIGV